MKRFMSVLLVLMLALTIMPAPALASSTKTVYISSTGTGTINLRAGAGYEYEPVGYAHHNDKVTVQKKSGSWSKVKVKATGATGWLRTMYIDGTTKNLGSGYKAIKSYSPVYTSAYTTSSIAGYVGTSDTVRVYFTEHDRASVVVTDSGLTGWIPIGIIGKTVKIKADKPPAGSHTVYHVKASALNVRTGPGTGYGVVGVLYKGTGCIVLESSGNWRKIRAFNGVVGWVSKKYLATTATATVTASALNIRKGPGTGSAILGSVPRGTKVKMKYTSGNWAYVTAGKLTGYCSMTYLAF